MDVIMKVNLFRTKETEEAYKEYEKAKEKLQRCLQAERLEAEEVAAPDEDAAV